jgi:2-hydroxy-5-methyl-1-naphthoate 7-hydroxylase
MLDMAGMDVQGEAARMRRAGPAVPVLLPGGIPAWAIARYDTVRQVLADPRVSRSADKHWPRWQRGEITPDWPLYIWAAAHNMGSAYGEDHRRLRSLMSGAFTARRTEALRPQIEDIAEALLDTLAAQPGDETADIRAMLAYPMPVEVIGQMFGLPMDMRDDLRRNLAVVFEATASPEEIQASTGAMFGLLHDLVEFKTSAPGDDLTSAMLATHHENDGKFTHKEIVDTLSLMLVAGHETTINLLDSAVTAMLTHPGQLELVRAGERSWSDVIEETLRWQAPIAFLPLRYAVEDIELDGVVIPKGDAILVSYAGAGRDKGHYGETADQFDITRADKQHLSFGYGVHHCLGAPLARLEAGIALPALFGRFPDITLAVDPSELTPTPSLLSIGHTSLPVYLRKLYRSNTRLMG